MKRTLQAMMACMFVTMLLACTVSAATSQGLEWGVAVGDQWNFDITSTNEGVAGLDEVIYMEVLTRPTIPNVVSILDNIPDLGLNMTWANGTSLGWSALIFIFLAVASPFFVCPIGNYTLLGALYTADSFYNGTIYDQSDYWGFNLNGFELIPGNASTNIHVDFLKQDGVLAHWTVVTTNTTSSAELATLTMTRQGLPSFNITDFLQNNILLVGIGVGVIVILGAVVCMRRK
jgi:hypothetical protein